MNFLSSYSFQYPSFQILGEDLVTVLDFLHVKYVIGLGEGAGANVLARFGLAHPARCLGLILINCTGSATSVFDAFKTKVNILKFFVISINHSLSSVHQLENGQRRCNTKCRKLLDLSQIRPCKYQSNLKLFSVI